MTSLLNAVAGVAVVAALVLAVLAFDRAMFPVLARDEGYRAGLSGAEWCDCPHEPASDAGLEWRAGWAQAYRERLGEVGR